MDSIAKTQSIWASLKISEVKLSIL